MDSHSLDSLGPLVMMPTFMFTFPTTAEVGDLFGVRATFQRWLDVESALARSEAHLGVIPVQAANEISRRSKIDRLSIVKLKEGLERTSHPIVALTDVLKESCRPRSLGEYVHYGVTTQDIIDTGFALQLRDASKIFERDLKQILRILMDLAVKHKRTLMVARTHHVQAAPTTFGFKISGWAWEVARDLKRVERMKDEVSIGSIGGAVGTFSVIGKNGVEVQKLALNHLGLRPPPISWHSSRDVWAEYGATLAIAASTLGRIANEIMTLQMSEIGELEEPRQSTDISSSIMPHKRNPIHSETMLSVCNLCWEYEHLVVRGMITENERDDTSWGNQLVGLIGLCKALSWMLQRSKTTLGGLTVNADRMRENLGAAGPSIYSEFFVGRMGQVMGARKAHELLHEAFMKTVEEGGSSKTFWRVLSSAKLPRKMVEGWMDPLSAVGLAVEITETTVRELSRLLST